MPSNQESDLYERWKQLVNMTEAELRRFLLTEEGKSGHDSARALLRMIPSGKSLKAAIEHWTTNDWEWAKRQVSFISRMKGNAGPLYDANKKTRKHTSLLLWGHNPAKIYTVSGTSFDPTCILPTNRNPLLYRSRDDQEPWAAHLSFKYTRLIVCEFAEKFALPLFQAERPKKTFQLADMQRAIELGRVWANTGIVSEEIEELRRLLEVFGRAEFEYRAELPGGGYLNESASFCIQVVRDCLLYNELISVNGACFSLSSAVSRQLMRQKGWMLTTPGTEQFMAKWYEGPLRVVKTYIFENFFEAEAEAREGGYPEFSDKVFSYNYLSPEAIKTFATLTRLNMIERIREAHAENSSEALLVKINLADEAMRRIDDALVYERPRPVSFWKGREFGTIESEAMACWQVFLNHAKDYSITDLLKTLRTAPKPTHRIGRTRARW